MKGFVTVCPAWKNINRNTYRSLCHSAYSDEEYAAVEREARIIAGDEHSNVRSMHFNGYVVPHGVYFMTNKTTSMTVSNESIRFSKECIKQLEYCEAIELLYHPMLQTVIIRPCDANATTSINWKNDKNTARLIIPDFCRSLYDEMDWMTEYSFRFRGITRIRGNQKIVIFFLDEPQILVSETDRCQAESGDGGILGTQYIPYKKGHTAQTADIRYAYPDAWADERFGMTYQLYKRRENTINAPPRLGTMPKIGSA